MMPGFLQGSLRQARISVKLTLKKAWSFIKHRQLGLKLRSMIQYLKNKGCSPQAEDKE